MIAPVNKTPKAKIYLSNWLVPRKMVAINIGPISIIKKDWYDELVIINDGEIPLKDSSKNIINYFVNFRSNRSYKYNYQLLYKIRIF